MVYIDWNRLMAITPDTFTEDDKEEMVESIVWYAPPSDINRKQLLQLIKILQEIMKHKVDQVESLMGALDELAAKQGEEVARGRQELLDEIDELREQVEYQRRMERDSGVSDDQLRSEVVRLEMQNEEMLQELQEREKDLVSEKAEAEKLVSQVARLEREKLELSRELAALQEEASERRDHGALDSPDGGAEKVEELVELVRQKNKHIMQLLDDIEAVEQDNQAHKVKLTNTRDELTEANKAVAEVTEKMTAMQVALEDAEHKVAEVMEQKKALASQVEELIEKKIKHDKDLDEFAITLNSRVEEWRRLLDVKDMEIVAIREELNKYVSMSIPWSGSTTDPELKARFLEQEEEIVRLKTELGEVHREREKNLERIAELKEKLLAKTEISAEPNKEQEFQQEIAELKTQLKSAEEDATSKAEEITKLVIQVRAFEREEFGLTEAMDQIKRMERRLNERELKGEQLITACNKLEIDKGNLEDENIYLRDKLGLSPTHQVDSSSVRKRFATDAATIADLKAEIEKLREEVLDVKLKNREMKSQIKARKDVKESVREKKVLKERVITNVQEYNDDDVKLLEEKYIHIVEENDALRKGMHEILDGIHKQTVGEIQASSLERLLEALDARHISGWYHPAMRLQAQLNTVQGEARELRNQLQGFYQENRRLVVEFQAAQSICRALEEQVLESGTGARKSSDGEGNMSKKYWEDSLELEKKCIELDMENTHLKFMTEKAEAEWEIERRNLLKERDDLLGQTSGGDLQEAGGGNKAVEFLKMRELSLEAGFDEMRSSFFKKREEDVLKITSLQNDKSQLILRLKNLKNSVNSGEKCERLVEEVSRLKEQLAKMVNAALVSHEHEKADSDTSINRFDEEKWSGIVEELKSAKEKLIKADALLNSYGQEIVTPDHFNNQLAELASKLSATEARETSENLKRTQLEGVNQFLSLERAQLESRVNDLTNQAANLSEANEKLHSAVVEVRNELLSLTLHSKELEIISDLETKLEKSKIEKINLEELLDISRSQCRSLQSWQEEKALETDAFNECLALLQTSASEKMVVATLSQELLEAKKNAVNVKTKNSELETQLSKLHADNLEKESRTIAAWNELNRVKERNFFHLRILYKFLSDVHSACLGAVLYPNIERAFKVLTDLDAKKSELEIKMKEAEAKERGLVTMEKELEIQLDALHDLKAAFQSDSKNLVTWHNKSTELRLRENRFKRENEHLLEQVRRLEVQVKSLKKEMIEAEEKIIEREHEFEERQQQWLECQTELCQMSPSSVEPNQIPPVTTKELSASTEINQLKEQIKILKDENKKISTEMSQKEAVFKEKLSEKIYRGKSLELEEAARETTEQLAVRLSESGPVNESEKVALQVTVNSLQSIVKQKEETIVRYQDILKKAREEHGNATRRLQNELRNVHNALAMQSKAYSRLKHGAYQPAASDVERYVTKIQEMEEELNEAQSNLSRLHSQLKSSQQDAEKWKDIAEERMALVDETRERMEMELDQCREELHSYQMEAQQMRELVEGGQGQKLIDIIQDMQRKVLQYGDRSTRPVSARRPASEEPVHGPQTDELKRQLKSSRDECNRLREQIKAFRDIKRRPSSAKLKPNHENLVDKIRNLEEMLKLSKQHEHELEESGLKKMRSVEEVTRWDERKRYQRSLERLNSKLKQKEVEVTVAINKMETMRALMSKMEREKGMLEVQVRNYSESARESHRLEKMMAEKAELVAQVTTLEEELAALQRHQGGKAAVMLHAQLEAQERKIASLELSGQAPSMQTAEVERLKATIATIERDNIQLETENLNLKLTFERAREENEALRETCRRLDFEKKANKVPVTPPRSSPSRTQSRFAYESQREVNKLKAEIKMARERLNVATNRNAELEEEIQRLRNQLSLWEEKDMADSLSKTSHQQIVSDLHQELMQTKAQLTHKIHLLDKVKILLSKAAAKEKALNEKVAALQTIVEANTG